VVSLSENIFDVDKGTMFYGLLYPFLAFSNQRIAVPAEEFKQKNILAYGQPQC